MTCRCEQVELSDREMRGLTRLAARVPEGYQLVYLAAHRTRYSKSIDAIYLRGPGLRQTGMSLIGNKTIAQVEAMVEVMLASVGATLAPRGAVRGGP